MSERLRVAIASYPNVAPEFRDDETLLEQLRSRGVDAAISSWDDASFPWNEMNLIVARSVWDYAMRYDEFMRWLDGLSVPVENDPGLIRWNSDKRYLDDLLEEGLPVVPTTFLPPGASAPSFDHEVVIKPTISAGGRRTGRFGPSSVAAAEALLAEISEAGLTAMVQPYLPNVERAGETAVVMIDGEVSHVLRKGAILAADEVAPVRADDYLGVAERMYDPELVLAGEATDEELDLAERILGEVRRRFDVTPLYARVDMLRGDGGEPLLLELEAVEPNLYFPQAPEAAELLADAIVHRARRASTRRTSASRRT
ncbi:MAG: hypothetical protein KDB58_13315 [Solirubrobacterales bacterium]|nr:hypothetical protein [Solirubrobacterales bacterium]